MEDVYVVIISFVLGIILIAQGQLIYCLTSARGCQSEVSYGFVLAAKNSKKYYYQHKMLIGAEESSLHFLSIFKIFWTKIFCSNSATLPVFERWILEIIYPLFL